MSKKQLLFVTYHDDDFEEGLSYAIDLAKVMGSGISLLMIYKRKVMEQFGDMMTIVTFAEANEHKTAKEMIKEDYERRNEDYEERLQQLIERCGQAGISVDVSTAAADVDMAIKNVLRQNSGIEMVLLSPSITKNNRMTARDLKRLVKTASRPIVTMAKNDHAA